MLFLRLSDYPVIRLLVILLMSVFLFSASLAAEVPRFYGEEVVVTALRMPRLKSSIPWTTKLITRKEIEDSTAVKLGDVLRSVAGVAVKSNGGLSSQLSARLRGSNSQQVLVLLNGNRINSPGLGTFDLGDILLTDVEKIEVVKAPLSALYGADAVGGVVNIITRKAAAKPELEVAASYGEFATRNYSVSSAGPNYFFSITELKSNGFRANSDYQAHDYNLRWLGDIGQAHLEVGAKHYTAEKGSPGSLDFLTPQARQRDDNNFYDLSYQADAIGFRLNLSLATLDQRYANPAWSLLSTHKTASSNYDLQQKITWFPGQTMLAGVELRNDRGQSTNSGTHELANKAVFLQDELAIADLLTIVLGGREDINSVYGSHFNPRVGAVYSFWPDTLLKASWGSSFKAPTIDDLYWAKTTEPGWPSGVITTEGNTSLRPETAQGFDLTLEKKLGRRSGARVSYYQSAITDMIRWTNTATSTSDAYWTPLNVNQASIQGVEFELVKGISGDLAAFVNLTYQTARDSATDNFLDYSPRLQYNTGLRYRRDAGAASSLLVRHVGERYTSLANTVKLPAYTVVDLSWSKTFGRWQVKADVENLFNASYAESYGSTDIYPMPGRRYNIGVSKNI